VYALLLAQLTIHLHQILWRYFENSFYLLSKFAFFLLQTLGENKLRAFEQGAVAINARTALSRKEREDLRAKIEANETEEALKEFVAAFEEPTNKINKTFIKGGVFNPGSHEETPSDRGKTYRTSFKKDDPVQHSKDTLQQQIAKSNAAALAAAAALSAAAENKPVSRIFV